MYMYVPANGDFTPIGYTHKSKVISFKLVLSACSNLSAACCQHHLEVTGVIERIEHPNVSDIILCYMCKALLRKQNTCRLSTKGVKKA